ncbi:hypothetical protein [Pedobacter nototheniae]|uniref:hypothetical protein n=1 Tax=Pedobacter nototheniae TaxID=2488994 RepID=UPI002930B9DE|nr:hypothetical protein [Pedobacter nototheniae]
MAALLFCIGLIFILYNLILNLTNLTRIVNYCLDTGSLDHYWSLFYEACFHRRAIYSSIIISLIGLLIFIVIAPIVIIKGIFTEKQMEKRHNSGAYFKYTDSNLTDQKFSYSNLHELGIDKFESTATGKINIDFALVMGYIEEHCRNKKIKINQSVFQTYDLSNKMRVLIPISIEKAERVYPLYLIYNDEHRESYQKINPTLKENHFENALYLSLIPM